MPVPTSYTETELASFMLRELRSTAQDLGWSDVTPDGDFAEAIIETLVLYGVDEIALATNITKLRALARVAVWDAAAKDTVPAVNHTADGASISDEQVHTHCVSMLNRALAEADPWLTTQRQSPHYASIEVVL